MFATAWKILCQIHTTKALLYTVIGSFANIHLYMSAAAIICVEVSRDLQECNEQQFCTTKYRVQFAINNVKLCFVRAMFVHIVGDRAYNSVVKHNIGNV